MTDGCGRKIEYLRLSVTDLCNYRCIYCMGENGVIKKDHGDILSIEELTDITKAASLLGISKIRITGGEPLIRKGVLTLCRNIKNIGGIKDLSITTNGCLLKDMALPLKESGVDRLNISIDTLDPEKFRKITRCGSLDKVIDGIEASIAAGFQKIKINTVLLGGINTDEIPDFIELTKDKDITVRFIELMPIGVVKNWDRSRFVSSSIVKDHLKGWQKNSTDGVSVLYKKEGYQGTVGLISPMSDLFCDKCNRIRITADGKLKPCLHSDDEIDLKGLKSADLLNALRQGINMKPQRHTLSDTQSCSSRSMNEIGG